MKKKILSLLTAFAMVFGIIAGPFTSSSAAAPNNADPNNNPTITTTESVTLHKLMLTSEELKNWKALEEDKYDGTQDLAKLRTNSKIDNLEEIEGVYFALKFAKDYKETDKAGKYVKADSTDKLKPADPLTATDKVEEAVGGLTTKNGIVFKTNGLSGKFVIDEISDKSTYVGKTYFNKETNAEVFLRNGKYYTDKTAGEGVTEDKVVAKDNILTGSLAVPVEITLPLVNKKGTVKAAHVYPKNSQNRPQIDKNFKQADTAKKEKELEKAEGFKEAAEGAGIGVGAKYENYAKDKATAKAEIGKKIPYEVKTKIPAKSKLKLAKWDDHMTNGLTYNKDLEVKIGNVTYKKALAQGEQASETLKLIETIGELTETDSGFELALSEAGLKEVNGKDADVEVTLTYSAKVNKDAMVDVPDKNEVRFKYGNNPSKETKPVPTKPKNGELTITKTWDDGKWANGESATFELRDATTGRAITKDDIAEDERENFQGTVTLKKGNASYTWKGLDNNKTYIAVEIDSTSPSDVEYVKGEDGQLKATNHRSPNPKELKPTDPKVVTGGRKFVKTNDKEGNELKRLAGAKFWVTRTVNSKKQYLVRKTDAQNAEAKNASDAAQDAYKGLIDSYNTALAKAIKDYKGTETEADKIEAEVEKTLKVENVPKIENGKLSTNKDTLTGKTAIFGRIDELGKLYTKLFKEAALEYAWEENPDENDRVSLVSDTQGRFEISGLEYGQYALEEYEQPADYAKLDTNEQQLKFEVKKGSYKGTRNIDFKYTEADTETNDLDAKDGYGQRIKNKKVTIPQTGGIGSLIFIVVGLAIMGGAFVAYKKSQAVEA